MFIVATFKGHISKEAPFISLKHTLVFEDTDLIMLRVYVRLLLFCVTEFEAIFRGLIYWR